MVRHAVRIALLVALVCARPIAGPTRDYPVVSTIDGTGVGDTAHAIQSDGSGPYFQSLKGSSGVESHLQSGGAWELDVYYFTTSRRLSFNLPMPLAGAMPDAPTGFITVPARLITKCPVAGENPLQMHPSTPIHSCALDGRFDLNGKTYLIRMDPARFPGSTQPRITCTAVSTSNTLECRQWKIDTCAPGEVTGCSDGILTLAQESTTTKGRTTTVRVADYPVQFEIGFTRP